MDFWIELQIDKWTNAGWIVMYVISILLLYKNRKNWDVKIKKILVFVGLSIILFFFPPVARVIYYNILPGIPEYNRITWLFFVAPIIAYTFVKVLDSLSKRQRVKGTFAFIIVCVLLSASPLFTRAYRSAENEYKVPDYAMEISDVITDDCGCYDDEKKLFGMRQIAYDDKGYRIKPKVLIQLDEAYNPHAGGDFFDGIRQYASAPILSAVIIPKEIYNSGSFQISKYVSLYSYEYFVCTNNDYLRKQAETYGYKLLAEVEGYLVYKNNNEVTIYFVRHGETEANANDVFAGSKTDTKLTSKGVADAKETGNALSDIHFDTAYVSELSRTNDTAKYILEENKREKPKITKIAKLNDINAGQLEGLSRAEVMAKYPDFSEDKYYGTISDSGFVSPVGATSKYTSVNNYKSAILNAVAGTPTGGNALIVGHGGFSWMLQTLFPDEISDSELPDNASITVIKYNKGKFELESYNKDASQFEEIEQ